MRSRIIGRYRRPDGAVIRCDVERGSQTSGTAAVSADGQEAGGSRGGSQVKKIRTDQEAGGLRRAQAF